MEILKYVILGVHIIGVASLLGGALIEMTAKREGGKRVVPAVLHGAWTMLVTGILLVGMNYAIDDPVDNAKITVKLGVLVAIIVIALINRKKVPVATWVLPTISLLTVVNIFLATVWRSYS
ncbi:hypothetical protein [Microbacterium hominis]|uniref:Integral membrane protein n=1 Tax=Microbacterium hominis TaxID=162426 RepID=A0A7D4UCM6_9MICO|nr:hypothetical protein [Microbacterium hominis]QKJ20963.1 hypothetical protein HQM25_17400 [Microbacterium hominis]